MAKMMGKNLKYARCKVHGQSCGIVEEMRPPIKRSTEKANYKKEIDIDIEEDLEYREEDLPSPFPDDDNEPYFN